MNHKKELLRGLEVLSLPCWNVASNIPLFPHLLDHHEALKALVPATRAFATTAPGGVVASPRNLGPHIEF